LNRQQILSSAAHVTRFCIEGPSLYKSVEARSLRARMIEMPKKPFREGSRRCSPHQSDPGPPKLWRPEAPPPIEVKKVGQTKFIRITFDGALKSLFLFLGSFCI